jgi:hypothetical protein
VQQRDHGYLLEILAVSFGMRIMIWGEISNMMRKGEHTEESIQMQYNKLEQECFALINAKVDEIKEAIRKGKNNNA